MLESIIWVGTAVVLALLLHEIQSAVDRRNTDTMRARDAARDLEGR